MSQHLIGKAIEYFLEYFGKKNVFFSFNLFRNAARQNSQFELSTRFIALASVGNASKDKFIYALNVTAVDKMRLTDLIQKTTNEIPCPYDSLKFSIGGNIVVADPSGGNQFFYDFNTNDDHRNRKRGKFNQDGGQHQKRPRQPDFDQGEHFFFQICKNTIKITSVKIISHRLRCELK